MREAETASALASRRSPEMGFAPSSSAPRSLLANERAFTVMVRNALFRRVQAAAFERYDELAELDGPHGFGAERWRDALDGYFGEHDEIRIDADARSARLLELDRSGPDVWRFRQVLLDPRSDLDWGIEGTVDLEASERLGEPVILVERVGSLDA